MSSTSHNISNNNADNSGSITTATLNVSVPGAAADNIRTKNIYTSISTTCTSSLLPLSSCLDPCSTDVLRQPAEKQHRQEDSPRNAMNTDSARFHGEISEEQDNDDDDEGENGLNHPEEGSKSIKRMTNGENDASNSLSSFSASAHERISSYGPLHIQHVHEHENRHPPPLKLTLSAYRKPESAVRLTSAPPNRLLSHDYDLKVQVAHSPSSSSSSPSPSNNNSSSSNIKKDNNNNSRILGHGASSTVRLARHRRTNQKVAVKCIGKHLILRNHLFQKKFRSAANTSGSNSSTKATANTKPVSLEECDLLKLIRGRHENIINLLDVYETDNEVQMVMEYCAGGELYDDIITRRRRKKITSVSPKKTNASDNFEDDKSNTSSTSTTSTTAGYTEAQAAQIARQMLSALSYLHSNGIVHRDVKPENILLVSDDPSDLTVKLSDFGLARILPEVNVDVTGSGTAPLTPPGTRSRAYSRVGSDYYAAPEVTFGSGGYGTAVDVYSLGVTLYILLSGVPPASKHQPRCGSFVLDGSCGCGDDEDVDDSSYDSECSSPSLSSYSSSEEDLTHDKVSVSVNDPKDHGTSTCSTTTRKLKNKTKRVPPIDFPSKQWSNISNCAKDLIRRMLHPDPNLRIQAQDALQHEWILSYGNQNQHNQMYKQYLLYPRLDQQEQLEKLQHPLRYNQKLKINTASKPPTTTAFSPLSFSTTGFSDNPKSSSVLPKLKWSFFNSNNLEQKKKKRKRPVNEANADGDERDSSEQKRKCANKKMKTTSRGRRPSIDFRIPPPKNVPISMVELYHRMSSAAAAATVVTGTNNINPNSTPTKNNCNEKKAVVLQRQPQHQVNVNVNGPVDSVSGDCDSDSDMSSSNSDAKAAVKQQQPQQQRQKQQQQQQKPPCFTNSGALALSV